MSWVSFAIIAAVLFGLGDFIVVYSGLKDMNIITMYVTYTILIGLINIIYLLGFMKDGVKEILQFNISSWTVIGLLCFTYFFAYILHFIAIQNASNPGYANALVMFHVVVLTVLSTLFLKKPINKKAMMGMFVMFVGSYLVIMNS